MRKPALEVAPELEIPERTPLASLEVTLITRLFGGGAMARDLDEISWLRSAALKSALRFWWRAGHAHNYDSLKELREREEHLFGASAVFAKKDEILGGPGVLEVEVQGASRKDLQTEPFKAIDGDAVNIAYFSAAEQKKKGIRACTLALPDKAPAATIFLHSRDRSGAEEKDRAELLEALRLWLVLGGVGSRTRRGAGALGVTSEEAAKDHEVPATLEALKTFLLRWARPEARQPPIEGLFSLGHMRAVFVGPGFPTAEKAHRFALDVLRELRQDRPHPPSWKGPAGWGQTRWPDADAIRWKAGPKPGWKHPPTKGREGKYPRAALGLPIVVHYKDGPLGDPDDHIISAALPDGKKWKRVNRFASPLILRPVQVWENGKPRYVPVALIGPFTLPTRSRPLVELTKGNGDPGREVDPRNVFTEFSIDSAATHDVLPRLETAFAQAKGFVRLP